MNGPAGPRIDAGERDGVVSGPLRCGPAEPGDELAGRPFVTTTRHARHVTLRQPSRSTVPRTADTGHGHRPAAEPRLVLGRGYQVKP